MTTFVEVETAYPYNLETFVKSVKDDPAFGNLNDKQQDLLIDKIENNCADIFGDDFTYKLDKMEIDDDPDYTCNICINDIYICIRKYSDLQELLVRRATDEDELFFYTPLYIYGFIEERHKRIHHKEINYNEPDPDNNEEDIPLFDTEDCPCCMEKFGITEIETLIGNHPTKKIKKKEKKVCVKRNTYCGHPICLGCFKTIAESNNKTCPICRADYEEWDIEINEWTEELTEEDVYKMVENQDDILLSIVDIPAVVEQAIIADGIPHLLRLDGYYCDDDSEYLFGVQE